ncbi:protein of unknown function [Halobacillus karajensis]|uniref:DUF4181 domain-containing protein n=1 Tax=Halobacillus karajensis TaxID=195088 RepID=UPI0008A7F2A3|nr:DUF4181 domain-containing protein [Halobacillus karajensis]SEI02249.1 protein of unknown function [Halobacillus karajensis]
MYGAEPVFLPKLTLWVVMILLFWLAFNKIMRKWLNVERNNFFSYNHVNEKHKKIDWTIRIITMISLLLTIPISFTQNFWLIQPWFLIIIFVVVSETVRAVMERKYAENPNAYKFTISQIIFVLLLFFTLLQTDLFGLV